MSAYHGQGNRGGSNTASVKRSSIKVTTPETSKHGLSSKVVKSLAALFGIEDNSNTLEYKIIEDPKSLHNSVLIYYDDAARRMEGSDLGVAPFVNFLKNGKFEYRGTMTGSFNRATYKPIPNKADPDFGYLRWFLGLDRNNNNSNVLMLANNIGESRIQEKVGKAIHDAIKSKPEEEWHLSFKLKWSGDVSTLNLAEAESVSILESMLAEHDITIAHGSLQNKLGEKNVADGFLSSNVQFKCANTESLYKAWIVLKGKGLGVGSGSILKFGSHTIEFDHSCPPEALSAETGVIVNQTKEVVEYLFFAKPGICGKGAYGVYIRPRYDLVILPVGAEPDASEWTRVLYVVASESELGDEQPISKEYKREWERRVIGMGDPIPNYSFTVEFKDAIFGITPTVMKKFAMIYDKACSETKYKFKTKMLDYTVPETPLHNIAHVRYYAESSIDVSKTPANVSEDLNRLIVKHFGNHFMRENYCKQIVVSYGSADARTAEFTDAVAEEMPKGNGYVPRVIASASAKSFKVAHNLAAQDSPKNMLEFTTRWTDAAYIPNANDASKTYIEAKGFFDPNFFIGYFEWRKMPVTSTSFVEIPPPKLASGSSTVDSNVKYGKLQIICNSGDILYDIYAMHSGHTIAMNTSKMLFTEPRFSDGRKNPGLGDHDGNMSDSGFESNSGASSDVSSHCDPDRLRSKIKRLEKKELRVVANLGAHGIKYVSESKKSEIERRVGREQYLTEKGKLDGKLTYINIRIKTLRKKISICKDRDIHGHRSRSPSITYHESMTPNRVYTEPVDDDDDDI
jgi:hypothetical protein